MRDENRAIAALRALAHPVRLRILAALDDQPVGETALSERTGVPLKTLAKELVRLETAGLVALERGAVTSTAARMGDYADALEARLPITEIVRRHDLERFFQHGVLLAMPVEAPMQRAVAHALIELVPEGVVLTETEVNELLSPIGDRAILRRLLVDEGLLERGAGVDYRRVPAQADAASAS